MITRTLHRLLVPCLLLAATPGCVNPTRTPLPAPFPLTRGGTPVPGRGVGVSLELGDGLQGQELLRKELLSGSILVGVADRVSLGVGPYGGHEDDDPAGFLATGKVRVGALLGPRTSTAVHLGVATVDRTDGDAQDEALTALDLAVPTELLVSGADHGATFGLYVGPRLVYENYRDRLQPADDFSGFVPGWLGGVHLGVASFHLFGEGTLAFPPSTSYRGTRFDGGPVFLPTAGIAAYVGSPFPWDR